MNLEELIERGNAGRAGGGATEITGRLVRFLVQAGVLLPPTGGRRHAAYPEVNLERLRVYQQMRRFNQSIETIRQALDAGAFSVEVAPGVLLLADPSASSEPADPDAAARAAARMVRSLNAIRATKKDTPDAA